MCGTGQSGAATAPREADRIATERTLAGRDICSKYIMPALTGAGSDLHSQIREEVSFTQGRIIVRGKLHSRAVAKRLAARFGVRADLFL